MRRTIKATLVSAAALVLGTMTVLVPGATAANASNPNIIWFGPAPPTGCFLHAHAHDVVLDVQCDPSLIQEWTYINPTTHNGHSVDELQLVGTNLCANYSTVSGAGFFYADSCQKGDLNELFWHVPVNNGVQFRVATNWYYISGVIGAAVTATPGSVGDSSTWWPNP